MGNLSHTVGGTDNLVSFKSAARVPIESLKCHFAPIQEGEGGPSPGNVRPIKGWNEVEAYRSSKNIARVTGYNAMNSANADTHNIPSNDYGTTISTNNFSLPDTSVTITQTKAPNNDNITNYQNGYFAVMVKNLIYGCYYDVSFKVTDVKNNLLNCSLDKINIAPQGRLQYKCSEIKDNVLIFKNVKWIRYSEDLTNSHYDRSNFEIRNCGMSFTLSEFMVTPVGMNDGVFEPYCGERLPITFPNVNKNIFELAELNYDNWTSEGYSNSYLNRMAPIINLENGTITITCLGSGDSILYRKTHYPPGTYTLSYNMEKSAGHTGNPVKRMVVICFKKDGTIITNEELSISGLSWNKYYKGFFNKPGTFTVPDTVDYFTICFGISGDTVGETATFSNIQLELGSEATAYETYNPDNTIYGGYVDLAKGEVVQEYDIYTFTGDEKDGFTYIGTKSLSYDEVSERHQFNTTILDNIANRNSTLDAYCNIGAPNLYNLGRKGNIIYYIGTPSKQVSLSIDSSLCEPTIESFNQWLSEHPLQLVYKLATPIHYPLNPTQLKTFLNNNAFWSNTNDVTEVSYAVHDTAPIRAAKKRIIAASPKLETLSSDLVTFNTDVAAPLKECKVYFEPVQEGEGDPSPDNIRPITGWNNIEVTKCGKNLFDISVMKSRPNIAVEDDTFIGAPVDMYNNKKTELFHIPKNTSINVSCTAYNDGQYGTGGSGFSPWFYYKNGNDICPWYTSNYLLNPTTYSGSIVFESDVVNYLFGYYNYSNNIWHVSNMQFEIGSSMTEYEPYNGTTISITFPAEAGTVYGGYVDLVNGEIIKNWNFYTITGEEEFLKSGDWISVFVPSGMQATNDASLRMTGFCSHYPYRAYSRGKIGVMYNERTITLDGSIHDAAGWKTYCQEQYNNGTPITLCYPLRDPIHYTIDPQTLKTLRGTNNIWSTSNGPISIKYWTH